MKIKRKKKIDFSTFLVIIIVSLLIIATIIYYNYNKNIIGNAKYNNFISIIKESELRTGPNDNFPIIKTLSLGDEIEKQSELGEWVEIKTKDNLVGWIAGWNISGSNIKSPEEKMIEKLKNYNILINPIYTNNNNYNFDYAQSIKKELNSNNINVFLSKENNQEINEEEISNIVKNRNIDIILEINITDNETSKGPEIYFFNYTSQILAKSLEKSLTTNYISKTKSIEKINTLKSSDENVANVSIILGNIKNKVDINILNDDLYKNEYAKAITKGIKEYLFYLIKIEDYNNKKKENLLNMPQKGMNIPFYYNKQNEYKNINYGTDNTKTIEKNGDAIIALAMISNYLEPNSITVENIVQWAGNNYYRNGEGTLDNIVLDFSKKYNFKVEKIKDNIMENINKSLEDNKPVLVKFKSGYFGNKITYKVIRGVEDGKYYINDPEDDDSKLNNYIGFSKDDIEKNILNSWIFSK